MPYATDVGTITRMGTRGYGAPELLFVEQEAQTNMDVFSFGVVIMQTFVHPEVAEHNMFTHSVSRRSVFLPRGRHPPPNI